MSARVDDGGACSGLVVAGGDDRLQAETLSTIEPTASKVLAVSNRIIDGRSRVVMKRSRNMNSLIHWGRQGY